MKSHDFGQFTFNNSIFNETQINDLIKMAKKSTPTLATEALFLQLISADEMTSQDDEFIRTLITPRQTARALELKDGQSLAFAQGLIDNGIANYVELERILDEYHNLEIPPIETAITNYYENLKTKFSVDFPLAVDVIRNFHDFLSETLNSTIVILPPTNFENKIRMGASVKIIGEVPVVIGLFASEDIFVQLATRYDSYVEMSEDAYDAISELLNVFTGHFVVKVAVTKGLDEEPEPPRFGTTLGEIESIALTSDIGKFYIYISKQEIFDKIT